MSTASLLDYVNDGIVFVDSNKKVVFATPAAEQLVLRYDPDVIISYPADITALLAHAKEFHRVRFLRALDRVIRDRVVHLDYCVFISNRNSDVFHYIEYRLMPSETQCDQVICYLRDVTAQQELRQVQLLAETTRLSAEKTTLKDYARNLLSSVYDKLPVDQTVLYLNTDDLLVPYEWRGVDQPIDEFCTIDKNELNASECQAIWQLASDHRSNAIYKVDIPLCWMGAKIGVLQLLAKQPDQCTKDFDQATDELSFDLSHYRREFFNTLGNYVAMSLQSIMLHEKVSTERALLRTLIETIPEPILLFDRKGEVLVFNSASVAISERPIWHRVGDESNPFITCDADGNPLPREEWPLWKAVVTGKGFRDEEYVLDFGDTKRRISSSVIPVYDDKGEVTAFVSLAQDITERSERDRRKDTFLSIASHELRSPLTPLKGFIQMLRHQLDNDMPPDKDIVKRAEDQVKRLQSLVDRLLDLGHIDSGRISLQRSPVNMVPFLQHVIDPWVNTPLHSRDFRISLNNSRITASIDPGRMDQVFTNIIDNAVKYSSPNDIIDISLTHDDDTIYITITDTGEGMSQETISRIFERFYRGSSKASKSSQRGLGLGLFICREIVELHGGDIAIESEESSFTRVTVRLPIFKD